MGANHGGAWGGLAPKNVIEQKCPKKTGFSPPIFVK